MSGPLVRVLCGPGVEPPPLGDSAAALGVRVEMASATDVDALNDLLRAALAEADGVLVSPGSLSLNDCAAAGALAAADQPAVEVHATNLFDTPGAVAPLQGQGGQFGLVCGLGDRGYPLALKFLGARLAEAGSA